MDKLKKHFKENYLIYLVLVTCIIIFGIISYVNYHPVEKVEPLDKTYLKEESLNNVLELFNSSETTYLVLGVDNCQATRDYVEYLRFCVFDLRLEVHYLDLNSIGEEDEEDLQKLIDKLNIEYTFFETTDKFGKFIGNTPMTIIIKDHKQVYGHIGSMNDNSIKTIATQYGLI